MINVFKEDVRSIVIFFVGFSFHSRVLRVWSS